MDNKKELPQEVVQALESAELKNIAGGKVLHAKDRYWAIPDIEKQELYGPSGAVVEKHGELSGPYDTEEDAIKAAQESGCTNLDVVEWEDFARNILHKTK